MLSCCQYYTPYFWELVLFKKECFIVCYFPFEVFVLKYCSLFLSIHVIWFVWQDMTCENVECGMYGMWDLGMWNVRDVKFSMWDAGCLPGCGMLIYKMPLVAGMEADEKLSAVVNELFLRERKLNILLAFISQCYFKVPKTMRINATHYFIMKIPNKTDFNKQHRKSRLTLSLNILWSFAKTS